MRSSRSSASVSKKAPSRARSSTDSHSFFAKLQATKSGGWSRIQKNHMTSLFKRMSTDVPAYRRFLRTHHADMHTNSVVPVTSKANYISQNAFRDLFWGGTLRLPQVLTSTSGSTGKPTYFARSAEVDAQSSFVHELIFSTSSLKKDKSTLVIVCFGMGVWIGGLITYQAFERMSRRGYPIAVLTPGINKAEIVKALSDVAPHYDQIILAGYPPFLKDVIDEALAHGISFAQHTVVLLFAAEAFTENFRDHLAKKVGVKNILTDAINIYGSADIGSMAFETPIAILARRLALKNKELFSELFHGTSKTPTLAQYIPSFVSFEAPNGEILISGDSAIPLLRYSIGDHGGVYTFSELVALFKAHGVDLMKEASAVGIKKHVYELPFVYVYERIDLATTLYGLQIYPETIKEVLLNERFVDYLTGKLTLITRFDTNQDQYLEVNLEQKPGAMMTEALAVELVTEIVNNLLEKNSEFSELSKFLGKRVEPRLVFWSYEDPLYFKSGIKQKWVKK